MLMEIASSPEISNLNNTPTLCNVQHAYLIIQRTLPVKLIEKPVNPLQKMSPNFQSKKFDFKLIVLKLETKIT